MASTTPARDRNADLQRKIEVLQQQMHTLDQEAIRELKLKLSDARKVVSTLEEELAQLIGKPAGESKTKRVRRPSITDEHLQSQVLAVMAKNGREGMNARQLAEQLHQDALRVRKFIASNPKLLKRVGSGPGTKFFLQQVVAINNMGVEITHKKIENASIGVGEPKSRAYLLSIDNGPLFAFLYVDSRQKEYTVAWNGELDFSRLHVEAVESIGNTLIGGKPKLDFSIPIFRAGIEVCLIMEDRDSELGKFKLKDNKNFYSYNAALKDFNAIAFARYDVSIDNFNLRYSITADNPRFSGNDSEIAIRQPLSKLPNRYLLGWIIAHHRNHEYAQVLEGSFSNAERKLTALINGKD